MRLKSVCVCVCVCVSLSACFYWYWCSLGHLMKIMNCEIYVILNFFFIR
jgi:hypothetical protein